MALPVWAWIVIGLLTIVGIVISLWGFFSGFKLHNSTKELKAKDVNSVIRSKRITQKNIDEFNEVSGVVGFFINIPGDDFFKPLFIDTTTNVRQWVEDMQNEISENKSELSVQVNVWLKEKEINLNKINFLLIIKTNNIEEAIEKKDELLKEINLSKRMFER